LINNKLLLNKTTIVSAVKLVRSAAILLLFLYLGKGLTYLTSLPISGSIFGLLLLFSALSLRLIPLSYLLPTANILLNYITLFFVPVGVGLLQYTNLLAEFWLVIVISSVVSTFAVLISVGWLYQKLTQKLPSNLSQGLSQKSACSRVEK